MFLNRIKEVIEEKKKAGVKTSQYKLAKDLGISYNSMNKLAGNKTQPSLKRLYEIALILNVSPRELLLEDNPLKNRVEEEEKEAVS